MKKILIDDNKPFVFDRYRLDYPIHVHRHMEIIAVCSGTADLYLNNKKFSVCEGDIVVVFPNQIHFYENSKDIKALVCMFSPENIPAYGESFNSKEPVSPIIRGECEDVFTLMKFFFEKYRYASREISIGFLQAIVGIILSNVELKERKKEELITPLRLLVYCNEHFMEPITVKDVSQHLNISVCRISAIFRQQLHTTFTDYIHEKRISYACDIFKSGVCNVTETAFASGFTSICTFGRVFTKYMGISPKQYIKSIKSK